MTTVMSMRYGRQPMSDSNQDSSKPSLVEGNNLRCPNCEELGDILVQFKPLDRSKKYESELNVIQQHRRDKGGCGHVFSPGDSWIMEEYLSGGLIPKSLLDKARSDIIELELELMRERRK
jgi:hypothetical protein